MPMTFEYERGATRCTIRYSGEIARSDLTGGIRAQVESGAWTCETVIDTLEATGILTGYADATAVTHTIARAVSDHDLPPRGPIVIIVKEANSAIHGMARLYQATTAHDARLRVEIVFSHTAVEAAFLRLKGSP